MSTAIPSTISPSNAVPSRAKYLSFLKSQPRSYTPWRESMSER